jgi:hypothetical protein
MAALKPPFTANSMESLFKKITKGEIPKIPLVKFLILGIFWRLMGNHKGMYETKLFKSTWIKITIKKFYYFIENEGTWRRQFYDSIKNKFDLNNSNAKKYKFALK